MNARNLLPYVVVCLLWLVLAIGTGYIAAVVLGGHGSVVWVIFNGAVGTFGAVGSCVVLLSSRLARRGWGFRVALVAAIASLPIVLSAVYGLVVKPAYTLLDAAAFVGPFIGFALIAAALIESLSIASSWGVSSAA